MKSSPPNTVSPDCEPSAPPSAAPWGSLEAVAVNPNLQPRLARWVELTEMKRKLEADLRPIQDELTAMEDGLLEDMVLQGISTVKINGMTVYKAKEFFCRAKEGVGRDQLVDGFRAAGMSTQLIPSWQALRALSREWSEAGEGPPAAIAPLIDVGEHYRLRTRKG